MKEFVVILFAGIYILLILFMTFKKKEKGDHVVGFTFTFLSMSLFCIVFSTFGIVLPFYVENHIGEWFYIIMYFILVVGLILVVWYKNFSITFTHDSFVYSNILGKKTQANFHDITYFNPKGDTIIIEVKEKTFYIMHHKRYVKNAEKFIELVKEGRRSS